MIVLGSVQPSYLAWIPLFERMARSDVFVHLDDVEYSKNSFHNRNRIKTPQGPLLLTVPVQYAGHSRSLLTGVPIDDTKPWPMKHWRSIEHAYARAPYFSEVGPAVREILERRWPSLADLNISLIEWFRAYLGITTPTYRSSAIPVTGRANEKLVNLCKHFGASSFIVKPGTETYHPSSDFVPHGITFTHFTASCTPYPQLHGSPFIPSLSILDFAMNCGSNSFSRIVTFMTTAV